jgi:hypothetical protein
MLKLAKKFREAACRWAARVCLVTLAVLGWAGIASATDPITLPTTGVDLPGHVTAAITAMGSVVVVVVGGYFAFLIIRKGLQWARGALRG